MLAPVRVESANSYAPPTAGRVYANVGKGRIGVLYMVDPSYVPVVKSSIRAKTTEVAHSVNATYSKSTARSTEVPEYAKSVIWQLPRQHKTCARHATPCKYPPLGSRKNGLHISYNSTSNQHTTNGIAL